MAPVNVDERNRDSSTIGSLVRRSTTTKAAPDTTAPARAISVTVSVHPLAAASVKPYTALPSASVINAAPGQSMRPVAWASLVSGTFAQAITTMIAIGTLIQNTARQENCSTRNPPNAGPIAEVIDVNPAQVPIAAPRAVPDQSALMIAKLPGMSIAPPTPCNTRAPTSVSRLGATAAMIDATVKITTPTTYNLRRPSRSPSEPPTRMRDARNSEYA